MIVSLVEGRSMPSSDGINAIRKAIGEYCAKLRGQQGEGRVEAKWIRLDLWANGLSSALAELEQSVHLAARFARNLPYRYEEDMPEEDRINYYRHLYFYKDAFIRLFSVLDKTGYFLDTHLDLNTGRVKAKFSYFTVLREMHRKGVHAELEQHLYQLKLQYSEPMNRLRRKRNLEIHAMNAELIDDVWQKRNRFADRRELEPLGDNMDDLAKGMEMVEKSMLAVFRYCTKIIR